MPLKLTKTTSTSTTTSLPRKKNFQDSGIKLAPSGPSSIFITEKLPDTCNQKEDPRDSLSFIFDRKSNKFPYNHSDFLNFNARPLARKDIELTLNTLNNSNKIEYRAIRLFLFLSMISILLIIILIESTGLSILVVKYHKISRIINIVEACVLALTFTSILILFLVIYCIVREANRVKNINGSRLTEVRGQLSTINEEKYKKIGFEWSASQDGSENQRLMIKLMNKNNREECLKFYDLEKNKFLRMKAENNHFDLGLTSESSFIELDISYESWDGDGKYSFP